MDSAVDLIHQLAFPGTQNLPEVLQLLVAHILFAAFRLIWRDAVNWARQNVPSRLRSTCRDLTNRRLARRDLFLQCGPFLAYSLLFCCWPLLADLFRSFLLRDFFLRSRFLGDLFLSRLLLAYLFLSYLFLSYFFLGGLLFGNFLA